jgi:hypothetical protein
MKMDKVTVQFWTVENKNGKNWYFEHTIRVYPDSFRDDVEWHIQNHNKHHGTTWQLYGKPYIVVV